MRLLLPPLVLLASMSPIPTHAGLVTHSVLANVAADFAGTIDSDSSTASSATIGALAAANNSFTDSDLTFAFNGTSNSLSGTALIVEEKTVSAKPGGRHIGSASLTLTFQTNSNMDYDFAGNWGFLNQTGTVTDSLTYILQDQAGTTSFASGSTTSGTGIASDSFSGSGTLGPGTYTFTIDALLDETINNAGTRQAGWNLSDFTLVSSTPEPGAMSLLAVAIFAATLRRHRRTTHQEIPQVEII